MRTAIQTWVNRDISLWDSLLHSLTMEILALSMFNKSSYVKRTNYIPISVKQSESRHPATRFSRIDRFAPLLAKKLLDSTQTRTKIVAFDES